MSRVKSTGALAAWGVCATLAGVPARSSKLAPRTALQRADGGAEGTGIIMRKGWTARANKDPIFPPGATIETATTGETEPGSVCIR